ncbi:ABC transporter substrate-binding protein [Conexibacter arvalis]|uniref:Peptide/nickel transport system substrate-binding protein n=1 Tax=Conexibacter arvalis TaxID=912552 RepID=A0A840IBP9_9ACTN|nr:ABC transporter substrate-binding protein [Conexibacter arvalis]MBB4662102.1 peptide/nickel transport system substrate-binding protein [Conexibacter arvalis]
MVEIDRRTFLAGGARTAGVLSLFLAPGVLTACGGGGAARSASVLTIAQPDTPPLLDGDQAFSLLAEEVMANCYGGDIVRYELVDDPDAGIATAGLHVDGRRGIADGLAASFEVSDDLREFTFRLRDDVKSYYGNPITAEAVKWSWERRRALQGVGGFFASVMQLDDDAEIEVLDERTIRFRTAKPSTLFLKVDAMAYYGGVVDLTEARKHITAEDEWAKEFLGRQTAGFGPYHVEGYRKGQQLTLVANPNHPGERPRYEKVVWRVVSGSSDRLAQLSRGDVGVATNLTPRELKQLERNPDVEVVSYPGNLVKSLRLNNTKAPFDDPRVRRALAYATPYQQILEDVYFGLASPLRSPLPEIIPGATDEFWEYDTDVEQARALLRQAGHGDGFAIEITYDVSVPEDELIGTILRTAFGDLGVRVQLNGVPSAVYADRSNGNRGDAFIGLNYPFVPDAAYHLSLYWRTDEALNTVGYSNPAYDRAIDGLLVATDEARRRRLAREAQRIWLQDMPWLLLGNPGFHLAHRPDLTGVSWYGDNQLRYAPLASAA